MNRWRWLIGIFVVALVVRVAWVWYANAGLVWADEKKFYYPAVALAEGRGFVANSFVPPGYPFFLGAVFRVWGADYQIARLIQCVLGAWTCLLLYGLGRRLVNERVGLIAAAALAIYLPQIYLAGVLYSECFVTCTALLTLWLAVALPGWRWPLVGAFVTGLALGYTTLTRSSFLIWWPVIGLVWLATGRRQWRQRVVWSGLLTMGFLTMLTPWTIRNWGVYGRLIPVSSGFPAMLWRANNLLARGDEWDRDLGQFLGETNRHYRAIWDARRAELSPADQGIVDEVYAPLFLVDYPRRAAELGDDFLAMDELLQPHVWPYVRAHPGRCLWLAAKRVARFFAAFTGTNTRNEHTGSFYRLLAALATYPVVILGLAGVALAGGRLPLLTWPFLTAVLFHAFVATATRFRLPLDPLLIVFGAVAVDWFWRRWVSGNQVALPAPGPIAGRVA